MKFTYLGTSSCEGIPALFCNCPRCEGARRLGGKNIRTRTQALINEDLLIDLPPDTLHHFQRNGIEGHKIKYLIITHSHKDHLCVEELQNRGPVRSVNIDVPVLEVYCTEGAYRKISAVKLHDDYVRVRQIAYFEPFLLGEYRITALPARHNPGDMAAIYLIEGEKSLLYAHDTGYFLEEVFDYLKNSGVRLDMVSYDSACVERLFPDESHHMGIDQIRRIRKRLEAAGVTDDKTLHFMNHFAHGGQSLYEDLLQLVEHDGIEISYDGCAVEL